MEINEEKIKAAFDKAGDETKSVLKELFPFLRGDVTERIKTFEDALNELGDEHHLVDEYKGVLGALPSVSADLMAYMKLRIITAALNEGWEPKFSEDEYRWYPWHYLYTQEELANQSEEWKAKRAIRSCNEYRVLFGGRATIGAYAGFVFAYAHYAPSSTHAYSGSRLCFHTEALAVYAGKQFIDLWMDFNLIRK